MPAATRLLCLQAWCLLGWYRWSLQRRSWRSLTASLRHAAGTQVLAPVSGRCRREAAVIGALVSAVAGLTPWHSRCLEQVFTLQRLLAARGIPGQFFLGVLPSTCAGPPGGDFAAHAWLQCGDAVVSGGADHQGYSVLSSWAWGGAGVDGPGSPTGR